MHAWLKEQVFVPELAAKHYFSIFSIFSFIRLHCGRVHKILKTLGVFCMPVVTKSSLAGPPQRHNIDPKRATDQANKLRPKAAEQQRPSKLKPPGKTGGCRSLPARTVGGTNQKAKKGNSLTAVRAFPDGCQGMA